MCMLTELYGGVPTGHGGGAIVKIVHAINDYTQAMQDGLRLAIRQ